MSELKLPIKHSFLWRDSKVVLHYLGNEDRNFRTCIAHRVNDTTYQEFNVAGKITRDKDFRYLFLQSSWFNGPKFLPSEEAK